MKSVFQTRFGKENGNCFQAVLASLFEIELNDVPDFCNIYNVKTDEWYMKFIEWLNNKGFSALPIKAIDDLDKLNYKDCYLIVTGKNSNGINHCVIYKNGKIIHNPNKKCKGIIPETIDLIFPLNPAEIVEKEYFLTEIENENKQLTNKYEEDCGDTRLMRLRQI